MHRRAKALRVTGDAFKDSYDENPPLSTMQNHGNLQRPVDVWQHPDVLPLEKPNTAVHHPLIHLVATGPHDRSSPRNRAI